MRLLLLLLACVSIAPGGYRTASAQFAPVESDRPFQRWLRPPQGRQSNVAEQLQLLELLRSQLATAPSTASASELASMPELTESQLQVLDQAYQAWTEQSGGAQLPDWDSVPKEWLDKALANPEQLKQAQRLIQQYARQRNLPQPGSLPDLPQEPKMAGSKSSSEATPERLAQPSSIAGRPEPRAAAAAGSDSRATVPEQDMNRQSSSSGANEIQRSESQGTPPPDEKAGAVGDDSLKPDLRNTDGTSGALGGSAATAARAASSPRAAAAANSAQPPDATDVRKPDVRKPDVRKLDAAKVAADANAPSRSKAQSDEAHFKALRQLLEAASRNAQRSANAANSPMPRTAAGPLAERSMAQPPPATAPRPVAGDQVSGRETANEPTDASDNASASKAEVANEGDSFNPFRSDSFSSDASDSPSNGTFHVPATPRSTAAAPEQFERVAKESLSSSGLRSAARSAATQRSGFQGSTARRSTESAAGAEPARNSSPGEFRFPQLNSDRSINFSASASSSELQAKIKRDIEQLGWQRALRRVIEDTFKDQPVAARPSQASRPKQASARSKPSDIQPSAPRRLNINAKAASQVTPDLLSDNRFAGLLADVWKAIATAPLSESVASSSPAAIASAERTWKWNGNSNENGNQVSIVLLIIAAVALTVWISRKRSVFFRSERALDTRWAKEALAQGIRTRADVIRAFHRFISQTAEPIAFWWTHRYVARRLAEARPQLAGAMSELSSIYEQARYMPPEAELSAAQIARVYEALRECVAYGSSPANPEPT